MKYALFYVTPYNHYYKFEVKMIRKIIEKSINFIWSLFLNGLLTLLPITITLAIFNVTFKLLKNWLSPLIQLEEHIPYFNTLPHAEFLLALIIIFLAGVFLKSFVIRSLLELFEMILEYVPLVRPVYTGIKQLVSAFSPTDMTFQQVVLVEFPRPGIYSIGFQTSQLAKELSPDPDQTFYSIFIPTTPNPTTGYFVVVKEQDFKPVGLTTQEAMALIISGGIVQPKRYK